MVRVFLPMASPPSYSRFYYVSSPSLFGVTFLYIITSLTGSFYGTDAMTSFSESNDDLNSDEDLDMGISLEQEEVQDTNVGQQGAVAGCQCWAAGCSAGCTCWAGQSPYTM